MNYQEFIYKWNWKFLDTNGDKAYECKDVFNEYNEKVVGGKRTFGHAKDIWENYDKTKYDRIKNTLTFVPKQGDVMVWGAWGSNPYGHVGIVNHANLFWFVSFDQNYPGKRMAIPGTKRTGFPCQFVSHSYTSPRVLGVLRPKQ
jgi:CHAP domain